MKILFMSISDIRSIDQGGIYPDLLKEFVKNGHKVYVVVPTEKRNGEKTNVIEESNDCRILRVQTGNLQKTGFIRKGISTIMIKHKFKKAIMKYFRHVRFDLIVYSTPPITFNGVVKHEKKRSNAKTLLLLKDIFPQNALDIGALRKRGLLGLIYRYFRNAEKRLYAISDRIGCMSEANKKYLLEHNHEIAPEKTLVVPNSILPSDVSLSQAEREQIRDKYGIPQDKIVFVYGGNLGKPQDIPFIIKCMKEVNNKKAYFLIVGSGTEYGKLEAFVQSESPTNVKLLSQMPRSDFDHMLAACNVGMIFLDHRFTIPNYPSRILSYMQAGLPVLACTDSNTDVGRDIVNGGFGWWCESNDEKAFASLVNNICDSSLTEKGEAATEYLNKRFTVADSYNIIMKSIGEI